MSELNALKQELKAMVDPKDPKERPVVQGPVLPANPGCSGK